MARCIEHRAVCHSVSACNHTQRAKKELATWWRTRANLGSEHGVLQPELLLFRARGGGAAAWTAWRFLGELSHGAVLLLELLQLGLEQRVLVPLLGCLNRSLSRKLTKCRSVFWISLLVEHVQSDQGAACTR
jgi:hypothetical protein